MLFPERRFGLVNNSNNLFDYLFSDPIFNVNVPNRMSTDIKEKENGAKVTLDIKKADNETLRAYLAEVLPNFDRERVYPTDIKKLISWYNLLVETGNTDFVEEEKTQKDADVENTAATDDSVNEKEEKSKTKKATKKKAE